MNHPCIFRAKPMLLMVRLICVIDINFALSLDRRNVCLQDRTEHATVRLGQERLVLQSRAVCPGFEDPWVCGR